MPVVTLFASSYLRPYLLEQEAAGVGLAGHGSNVQRRLHLLVLDLELAALTQRRIQHITS